MLNNVHAADVYTDFNGLAELKKDAKQQTPEAIKEVARQFESVFLGMVLKSMRAAKLSDGGVMDNDQSRFYQDMHDQQLSLNLAGEPGIGLADLIAKQLTPKPINSGDQLGLDDYRHHPVVAQSRVAKQQPVIEQGFESREDFIRQLAVPAKTAATGLGVDPKVLLAQAALETGWGKSVIKLAGGESSYNLFNIKAHQ